MNRLIILTIVLTSWIGCTSVKKNSLGNMLATMQVNEPIPGVCNNSKVIAILPFPGNKQIKAKAPKTDEELIAILNEEVTFLKSNPNFNDKGTVNLIVNCEGQMVRCGISNKTQSPELDKQIVDVFSRMKNWDAGTVDGKPVDTSILYSFTIENGVLSL